MASFEFPPTGGAGGGVTTLNTLTGDIVLAAGTGVSITPSGNTLTIANTEAAGPGGTTGQVQYNNAGAFGGFGSWNGTTLAVTGALSSTTTVSVGTNLHVFGTSIMAGDMVVQGGANFSGNLGFYGNAEISQPSGNIITALSNLGLVTSGTLSSANIPNNAANTSGTAANITATTNLTLTTLSALSLPASQVTGLTSGTVTSASVVSANGFAGTVATATTTPAITLTTSITGVLKGNGTAISAATSGTDFSAGTSGLSTGILKSTTTTGALTIAVAGDFPTLNQSTTGNAANVTGTVAIANGGTGQVTANAGFNALSPMFALGGLIYGGTAGAATNLPGNTTTTLQFLAQTGNGSVSAAPRWVGLSAPTTQTFTSGSGTYTTPPSALYIRVRLVGAGAGGAGSGTTPGAATAGGNTTFGSSLLVGNGGAINSGTSGGPGGSASLGSGPAGLAIQGGQGESVSTLANFNGGFGGASLLGGQASGGATSGNGQAGAQYGSGGGGAGSGAVGGSGPGGGAGGFVDVIITAPLGTYSYAVGAAGSSGTAGGSGFAGGAGTPGVIQVTEYYQ